MFDVADFVLCVQSLLLGPERAQERWQTITKNDDKLWASIPLTWRTTTTTAATGSFNGNDGKISSVKFNVSETSKGEAVGYTLDLIDIVFHVALDLDNKLFRPTMKIGALFSRCVSDAMEDGNGKNSNSVYVLSDELGPKDIAEHYKSIGAELDEYSAAENLNLATMFVNALRNFHRIPVDTCDKVVLFYKEFNTSLTMPLANASSQELSKQFVSAALLGVNLSESQQDSPTHGDTEKINVFRSLVKDTQKKGSPVKKAELAAALLSSSPPQPVKAKSSKPKYKVRAVQQKRPKARKLLPK